MISKLKVLDGFEIHVGRDKKGYFADVRGKIVAQNANLVIFGDRLAAWVRNESKKVPAQARKKGVC